mgnify:CR=1 FL=1
MNKLRIIPGNANDIPELSELYDQLNEYLAASTNYPGWRKDIYPTIEDAEAGVNSNSLFVAKIDNKVVGTIVLNYNPENSYDTVNWKTNTEDYSDIYVIHTLAVHPQFLNNGVGQALLEFSIKIARERGIKSIRLDVYQKNEPAIHLYKKMGFEYIALVDLGLSEFGLDYFQLYELVI